MGCGSLAPNVSSLQNSVWAVPEAVVAENILQPGEVTLGKSAGFVRDISQGDKVG